MKEKNLKIGGTFTFELVRDGQIVDSWSQDNIVVDTGLNYILDAALSAATQKTTFYLGLFSNNYTPITTTIITSLTEVTTIYDEAARPTWVEAGVSAKTITNAASPASFTFNAGGTIYGAFLCDLATKGDTASTVVIAASKFASSRAVLASDVLNVTYALAASST